MRPAACPPAAVRRSGGDLTASAARSAARSTRTASPAGTGRDGIGFDRRRARRPASAPGRCSARARPSCRPAEDTFRARPANVCVAASGSPATATPSQRVAEQRPQKTQRGRREIVRVVDERDVQAAAQRTRDRGAVFEQPRRFGERVAGGQAAAPHELVDVRAVEPSEDLRQIELAPALAVELGGVGGQRSTVLVFRRRKQRRRSEVRRVGIKRSRAAQRDGEERLIVDPGVAQLADQPQRCAGEPRRSAQPRDLRIDVCAQPIAPLGREERCGRALEDLFGIQFVDELQVERQAGLQRMRAEQLEGERVERRAAHREPARRRDPRSERARAVGARRGDDRGVGERRIGGGERGESPGQCRRSCRSPAVR